MNGGNVQADICMTVSVTMNASIHVSGVVLDSQQTSGSLQLHRGKVKFQNQSPFFISSQSVGGINRLEIEP